VADVTDDLLAFLRDSPTPFHAVVEGQRRLDAAGFRRLEETARWDALTPGKYQVTTTGTNLFAFVLPAGERAAFRIVGAHTDSPNLRLKPQPEYTVEGYAQLGVEVYGGVLLNSWLDRDLGLAGRVFVRGDRALESRLVSIGRPLLRIPQLAIHLDREVNDKGLVLNKQEHLAPIWGLADGARTLTAVLAEALDITPDRIVNSELMLFDLAAPTRGGQHGELIFSARLDNLAMCHAAISAITTATPTAISVVALFDHEEVGSDSTTGAAGPLLEHVLERLSLAGGGDRDAHLAALAGSRCVSADNAHAVHPNYPERHEPGHRPLVNHGPAIKVNSNQRYATSAETATAPRALEIIFISVSRVPRRHSSTQTGPRLARSA